MGKYKQDSYKDAIKRGHFLKIRVIIEPPTRFRRANFWVRDFKGNWSLFRRWENAVIHVNNMVNKQRHS